MRELTILLLGLLIIAIILRGLYVALRTRRGQIKLAIDKNIPQDVDLDALELAELPSGGARLVDRTPGLSPQNSTVEDANARATLFGLGQVESKQESIPVLMDPVQLSEGSEISGKDGLGGDSILTSINEENYEDTEESLESFGDPDSVLFDYGEEKQIEHESEDTYETLEGENTHRNIYHDDGMAAVMPDYGEEEWDDDRDDEGEIPEGFHEENFGGNSYSNESEWEDETEIRDEITDEYSSDDEIIAALKGRQVGAFYDEKSEFDDVDEYGFDDEDAVLPKSTLKSSFEDSLDEFPMTAGDRIGHNELEQSQVRRGELYKEEIGSSDVTEIAKEKSRLRSLLSAFGSSFKEGTKSPGLSEENALKKGIAARPEDLDKESYEESPQKTEDETSSINTEIEDNYSENNTLIQAEVLVINVLARVGTVFEGNDLLEALITSGLKFGEMNIFHYRLNKGNKEPIIFSVANILNPGTFDLNDMENFSTIGISLFLALPTQINNLLAFEEMLGIAKQVGEILDGEIKDDQRNFMTAQTIEHYRQRIRDFELRQLKTAGSRD